MAFMRDALSETVVIDKIEYLVDFDLKRVTRIFDNGDRLIAEYFSNLFGKDEVNVYVVSDGRVLTIPGRAYDKSLNGMSVEEYVEKGRPTIFYKASIAQILRINNDVKNIFLSIK